MSNWQTEDLIAWVAIARQVGWGAADILLDAQKAGISVEATADGPVTNADLAANHYILENLQASFGKQDFGYLSEETYKLQPTGEPLSQPYVWVIDPLDGTKDFIKGTGEYAVHIALIYQQRPILAVVACPAVDTLYFATFQGGTFVETRQGMLRSAAVSQRQELSDLTVVASRSHRNERFNQLMQQFPCQRQLSVGSVGGKIAAIVEQKADVYVALSGKSSAKDWDIAAPELILTEAGGRFTYFDGTPLLYNRGDVSQWGGLLASNGVCHDALRTAANQILATIASQS